MAQVKHKEELLKPVPMTMAQKKENLARNLPAMREKDRQMVKGIFRFHEVPGGVLSFVFKKYKEDQVEKFSLVDGEIYTIPLGVAKHLNNDCWYPVHQYSSDEVGMVSMKVGQKVRRCSFQSLEFMDDAELNDGPSLMTVELVGA
jgi:hypothetical protein